jgi:hypothetical protein
MNKLEAYFRKDIEWGLYGKDDKEKIIDSNKSKKKLRKKY